MTRMMTQAEFARHRGVGKSAVSNWKKDELLVFCEGPDGRTYVDVARTEARLNARIDPARGRPSTGGAAPMLPLDASVAPTSAPGAAAPAGDLTTERRELIREQRFGAALKNARDAGDLAPIVELEHRAAEIGRAARERVQATLRGLSERLAAETDPRTIMTILEAETDRVFNELADAAKAGAFDPDADDSELDEEELRAIAAAEAEEAA